MTSRTDAPGSAILKPLATDEYRPRARTPVQHRAAAAADAAGTESARWVNQRIQVYWPSRRGTATGLLGLNRAAGGRFFEVGPEAANDEAAAEETFASDGPVVDMQTHWIADNPALYVFQSRLLAGYHH